MKRLWLIVACVVTAAISEAADPPGVEWIRQFGTASNYDSVRGITLDGNDNIYLVGGTVVEEGIILNEDLTLTKYDGSGTWLWTERLGKASTDHGNDVAVDNVGNIYVTGGTKSNYTGVSRKNDAVENMYLESMILAKYNPAGEVQWIRQLGSESATDYGRSVSIDASGNSYVTGYTGIGLDGYGGAGEWGGFLTKHDTNGVEQWTRLIATSGYDSGHGVSVDGIGNIYVTGSTSGSIGTNEYVGEGGMFLTKYDASGVRLWARQMGLSSGRGVSVDASGNAYVMGTTTNGTPGGLSNILVTKYDPDGNNLWVRHLSAGNINTVNDITVDSLGSAYIVGYTNGSIGGYTNAGEYDAYIAKYDTDGNQEWLKQIGTTRSESVAGIVVNGAGDAYITGTTWDCYTRNINEDEELLYLMKLSHSPEPSTAVMLMIALGCLLWSRRRTNERTVCRG